MRRKLLQIVTKGKEYSLVTLDSLWYSFDIRFDFTFFLFKLTGGADST